MNQFLKTNAEIVNWLNQFEIEHYSLTPSPTYGFVVNVSGSVYLSEHHLEFVPVKFNRVTKDFLCGRNQLTSLEFCPVKVGEKFACHQNQLTSLKGCPEMVGENFNCSDNLLTSLEFIPKKIGNTVNCSYNRIESLLYFPEEVGGLFFCHQNPRLGELQETDDFSKLYQAHLIEKEKQTISQVLTNPHGASSADHYKI